MIVEFGDVASAELENARDHYENERDGLGDEFVSEIEKLVGDMGERPESFPKVPRSRFRRGLATRFPYQVVFYELPEKIRIICVAHQHQRPGYWRGRS